MNVRVQSIPLVLGPLVSIPKHFWKRLKDIGITTEIGQFQKTVILGRGIILRKFIKI